VVAEPAGELCDEADPRQWLGEVLYRLHDIGDDPTGLVGAQPDDEAEQRTSSQGADTIKVDASRRSQMRFDAATAMIEASKEDERSCTTTSSPSSKRRCRRQRLSGRQVPATHRPSGDVTWEEADPINSVKKP
jgi:hypothetical protein